MASRVTHLKVWKDWRLCEADGSKCCNCDEVAWNGFWQLWLLTSGGSKFMDIETQTKLCNSCKDLYDESQKTGN